MTGDNAFKLTECLDEHTLNTLTPTIIKGYPNTYTYTKVLAEDVVQQHAQKLPVTIFRPGIGKLQQVERGSLPPCAALTPTPPPSLAHSDHQLSGTGDWLDRQHVWPLRCHCGHRFGCDACLCRQHGQQGAHCAGRYVRECTPGQRLGCGTEQVSKLVANMKCDTLDLINIHTQIRDAAHL